MNTKPEYPIMPCGGAGQAACPPEPAILPRSLNPHPAKYTPDLLRYSWHEMAAHGAAQYKKGQDEK